MDLRSMDPNPHCLSLNEWMNEWMNEWATNEVNPLLCAREAAEGQTALEADAGWPETTSQHHCWCPKPNVQASWPLHHCSMDLPAPMEWKERGQPRRPPISTTLPQHSSGGSWGRHSYHSQVTHEKAENWGSRATHAETISQERLPREMTPTSWSFLSGNGDRWKDRGWKWSPGFPLW